MNPCQQQQNFQQQQVHPFAVKNGHYLFCSGNITELVNGVETTRKCGITLTKYGNKCDTDIVDGTHKCYKCYRQYHAKKGKEGRELIKKTKNLTTNLNNSLPMNFMGTLPQESQQFNNGFNQNFNQPTYHDTFLPDEINDEKLPSFSDSSSNDGHIDLREDFDELKKNFESQKQELDQVKNENNLLNQKIIENQSKFESVLMKSHEEYNSLNERMKRIESFDFKKLITSIVSDYTAKNCVVKTSI